MLYIEALWKTVLMLLIKGSKKEVRMGKVYEYILNKQPARKRSIKLYLLPQLKVLEIIALLNVTGYKVAIGPDRRRAAGTLTEEQERRVAF